jgi:hypothetical protein
LGAGGEIFRGSSSGSESRFRDLLDFH